MITILLLFLIFLLLALQFWKEGRFQTERIQQVLPGPPSLPIIGNLWDLRRKDLHIYLSKLGKTLGPIYRLRLWSQDIVVLNSTDLIKEALVKRSLDFAGRPQTFTGNFISFGGKDLSLGDYTAAWKVQKKLVHCAIQQGHGTAFEPVVVGEAKKLCEEFQSYRGTVVVSTETFTMTTCNVISSLIFGTTHDENHAELGDIHDSVVKLLNLWDSPSINILNTFPFLQNFPNSAWKDFLKAVEKRDIFVRQQIQRHKETYQKGKIRDITDAMMKYFWDQEKGTSDLGEITEEHIHMAIVDLFVGGMETTASFLGWAIAFLIHRPEIQDRIYREICDIVGDDRYPTYADRKKLLLLNATIAEVLRLRPIVPLSMMHRTTCDTSVAGYFIEKGTNVIPNLFGAHHDERKWSDPTRFRPERFLETADAERTMRNVITFGAGARLCMGEAIARMETFFFMAYLLKDFQFLPAEAGQLPDLHGVLGFLLKVKPYRMMIIPRPSRQHY
ncbi:steroid 21-hydroxylase [Heptranchias perlo]|uniref:steroid 21-hydroxylase n=1 Tax=Heptranchias perlo TaxID=212740 RepID=UPI00355A35A8